MITYLNFHCETYFVPWNIFFNQLILNYYIVDNRWCISYQHQLLPPNGYVSKYIYIYIYIVKEDNGLNITFKVVVSLQSNLNGKGREINLKVEKIENSYIVRVFIIL